MHPIHSNTPDDWNEAEYLALNRDVAAAVARGELPDGYSHYRVCGRAEGRKTTGEPKRSEWNEAEYLALNPDVVAVIARGDLPDGYTHYQLYGRAEDRKTSGAPKRSEWNEVEYLALNPDVAAVVARGDLPDGYTHYQFYGREEGRKTRGEPKRSEWNEAEYLALNPDVAAIVARGELPDGYLHYQRYGREEGRKTNGTPKLSEWNEAEYLAHNPDVAAVVARGELPSGYSHYQLYGREEYRGAYGKASKTTRLCLEPWQNLDFQADGMITPCCNQTTFDIGRVNDGDFKSSRTNEKIRALRKGLSTGNLDAVCSGCLIKQACTTDELADQLGRWRRGNGDPLDPLALRTARIHVTEDCNLRCTYCSLSLPEYKARTIDREQVRKIEAFLAAMPPLEMLHVNGHGETTFCSYWQEMCEGLVAQGHRINLLTNFARALTDSELDTLSKFHTVAVSLDTADKTLLKKIRRSVDIRNIVYNIVSVRRAASARGAVSPKFLVQCGLYDKNIGGVLDFAHLCVSLGIDEVIFWQLDKQVHLDDPDIDVKALDTLDAPALRAGLSEFEKARTVLTDAGIAVTVAGEFVRDLHRRIADIMPVTDPDFGAMATDLLGTKRGSRPAEAPL